MWEGKVSFFITASFKCINKNDPVIVRAIKEMVNCVFYSVTKPECCSVGATISKIPELFDLQCV